MSGKWKVRPSKRASLHSDHDTSSGSSSYKPKIVSPSLNGKFQNCDLQSHQISKVRDTSLTSHFKYGERLAETPSIVDEQCCVKEGKVIEGGSDILSNCLIIGDSILRYSSRQCAENDGTIDCNPGAKIIHIKQKLLEYFGKNPQVIYLHVGSNNLVQGFCGGIGYNGGWGKREMLDGMADLLSTARRTFPGSKIIANSILYRADISNAALIDLNDQLQLMCWNFGVHLVKTWHSISRRHLARVVAISADMGIVA
ncbi:hypothetical protein J6590_081692 [Homalodisca vitripennis]|nr:hypothetical protein J6590_081692 [Homalodisca vitripennis]